LEGRAQKKKPRTFDISQKLPSGGKSYGGESGKGKKCVKGNLRGGEKDGGKEHVRGEKHSGGGGPETVVKEGERKKKKENLAAKTSRKWKENQKGGDMVCLASGGKGPNADNVKKGTAQNSRKGGQGDRIGEKKSKKRRKGHNFG